MAQFRITLCITMLMGIVLITALPLSKTLAAPAFNEPTLAIDSQVDQSRSSQANPGDQKSWLEQNVPALERALIIFTSVNAVLLVIGGIGYVMKIRLENESVNTLATIKDRQDHT